MAARVAGCEQGAPPARPRCWAHTHPSVGRRGLWYAAAAALAPTHLEAEALLAGAEGAEVLSGLRDVVAVQADGDAARRRGADLNVKVHLCRSGGRGRGAGGAGWCGGARAVPWLAGWRAAAGGRAGVGCRRGSSGTCLLGDLVGVVGSGHGAHWLELRVRVAVRRGGEAASCVAAGCQLARWGQQVAADAAGAAVAAAQAHPTWRPTRARGRLMRMGAALRICREAGGRGGGGGRRARLGGRRSIHHVRRIGRSIGRPAHWPGSAGGASPPACSVHSQGCRARTAVNAIFVRDGRRSGGTRGVCGGSSQEAATKGTSKLCVGRQACHVQREVRSGGAAAT